MTRATLTGWELRAARELIGWNQEDFRDESGVSIATIRRMERYYDQVVEGKPENIRKLQAAIVNYPYWNQRVEHFLESFYTRRRR